MISFERLLKEERDRMAPALAQAVTDQLVEFAENWQERFGNDDLVADEFGVEGNAPPLSERTIDAREERGYDGTSMLYDPTLPHVDEYGTIADSITMGELPGTQLNERFTETGYHFEGGVATSHPIFPLNEYGGVGNKEGEALFRTTLLPTNLLMVPRAEGAVVEAVDEASTLPWRSIKPGRGPV